MSTTNTLRNNGALRLLIATVVVAVAGSLSLAAMAAPPDGPPGAPGMGMGMRGGHDGPGMAMGHPRQIERMLDAVNATPEQRAQVKQIVQAARADMAAQHEAGRKLHEQNQALFAQPTVDARAVEAARQQMLAQHDQASKRMTQVMLDVSRVLTPEQRKLLSERMAQRRGMMERHRAERDAMEAAPRK